MSGIRRNVIQFLTFISGIALPVAHLLGLLQVMRLLVLLAIVQTGVDNVVH